VNKIESKYAIMIVPDREGGYYAQIPELGIHSCWAPGDTIEDALRLLMKTKESLLELLKEDGHTPTELIKLTEDIDQFMSDYTKMLSKIKWLGLK